MSEVAKAIDRLLQEHVNDLLKSAGFKKRGRRYRRLPGDRLEMLTVEASTFNTTTSGRFTVGLAIVIPQLARRLGRSDVDLAKAKGFEGGICTCLGFLGPDRCQDRWRVQVDADNAHEGTALRNAVECLALPWFEKARTETGLMEILERDVSMDALFVRAILYSSKREFGGVRDMLGEVVKRRPDMKEWIDQWAKERDLFGNEHTDAT